MVLAAELKADVGSQRLEARGQMPDAGSRMSDVGRQQSDEAQKTESDDAGEDVAVATATVPNQSAELNGALPPPDEDGFVWPEGSAPTDAAVAAAPATEDEPEAPLPKLDDLVKRIPPAVRDVLDELFRAKFVSVKRVDRGVLKN